MTEHEPLEPEAGTDALARSAILAAVDRLAPILAESRLDELEVESGELLVRLARPRAGLVATAAGLAPVATPAPVGSGAPGGGDAAAATEPVSGLHHVTAPLTGIWYAAPSPGARPYVSVGSEIAAGQVIGLIEAMKLFNEIKSDAAGTVTRIMAEDGTLVKRQQPVLELDPG